MLRALLEKKDKEIKEMYIELGKMEERLNSRNRKSSNKNNK